MRICEGAYCTCGCYKPAHTVQYNLLHTFKQMYTLTDVDVILPLVYPSGQKNITRAPPFARN